MKLRFSWNYINANMQLITVSIFRVVVGFSEEAETKRALHFKKELGLLTKVLEASKYSRQTILTHPLVVLFLDQKWKRVRKYSLAFFFSYVTD
jgi:hypothetical protein